ncbi:DUF342 domain-containing protein [Thorsellia kenyensis]|uniref:DUF342 domain-containing protein n=1 Tax=Thorsellia kenyensis TaxID=1549888 RepID=A0ABV6CDD3_9GAMM
MQEYSVFRFDYDEKSNHVKARLNVDLLIEVDDIFSCRKKMTIERLSEEFRQLGYDSDYLNAENVKEFILLCQSYNIEHITPAENIIPQMVVATIYHAKFNLTISTDKLNAFLEIIPAKGGLKIKLNDVKQKMVEMNIVFGLNEELIEQLVNQGECTPTNIATGTPPEPAKPAHFISYVDGLVPFDTLNDEEEESFFDLFSLKKLPYIKSDVPIMRLVPKYDGVDGIDISGQFIVPESYPDIYFSDDLKGVKIDELDPNLLISTTEGKPILHRLGMSVVPYHEINLEGIGTQNIEFEGALVINGDLQNGINVKVSGDVAVDGTIGLSTVEASGNILTSAGIVGASDSQSILNRQVNIICHGDVKAKFIENANITTSKSVYCENSIIGSNITAGGSIIVGKRGVNSGIIRGGKLIAFHRITAGSIGSNNGLPTHLQVGIDLFADKKKMAVKKKYDEVLLEKQKLDKLIKLIFQEPERGKNGIIQRVKFSRDQLLRKIDELREQYQFIEANIHGLSTAKIIVYDTLYAGTSVIIGSKGQDFKQEIYNSVLYFGRDGDIKIGSLTLK